MPQNSTYRNTMYTEYGRLCKIGDVTGSYVKSDPRGVQSPRFEFGATNHFKGSAKCLRYLHITSVNGVQDYDTTFEGHHICIIIFYR